MDEYQLIAEALRSDFGLYIVVSTAGVLLARRGHRHAALALLFIAVLGTLAFSVVGEFSVGRFTTAIPVLVSGYVLGMGRRPMVVASRTFAAVVYLAFSWLLTPLVLSGGLLGVVFGAWGIPFYLLAVIAAFGWSFVNPPRGGGAIGNELVVRLQS